MNKKFKIKTGDTVIVITGKDKGKTGNVTSVLKSSDRVFVEGVNIVKRHRKATQESPGKIEEKETSIPMSDRVFPKKPCCPKENSNPKPTTEGGRSKGKAMISSQ